MLNLSGTFIFHTRDHSNLKSKSLIVSLREIGPLTISITSDENLDVAMVAKCAMQPIQLEKILGPLPAECDVYTHIMKVLREKRVMVKETKNIRA